MLPTTSRTATTSDSSSSSCVGGLALPVHRPTGSDLGFFFGSGMNWAQAFVYCDEYGGKLMTVKSAQKYEFLDSLPLGEQQIKMGSNIVAE